MNFLMAISNFLYKFSKFQVGVPVCNALLAFGQERYDEVKPKFVLHKLVHPHPSSCVVVHSY